ncbi:MAG TPA: hypothetical protein VGE07_23570 [Herpetosiphonaceae bacterium]
MSQIATYRRILTAIRKYIGKHGISPSLRTLAERAHVSLTTAWRAVHWLAAEAQLLDIASAPGQRLVLISKEGPL